MVLTKSNGPNVRRVIMVKRGRKAIIIAYIIAINSTIEISLFIENINRETQDKIESNNRI